MSQAEPQSTPTQRRPWPVASLVIAVGVVFAVWIRRPRGPSGEGSAVMTVQCGASAGERAECTPGAPLSFTLAAPPAHGYFGFFLVRPDRSATWYIPQVDGTAPFVGDLPAGVPWTNTVTLERDLPPGTYDVVGLFAARALTRGQLERAFAKGMDRSSELVVVRRELTLTAAESPRKGEP